MNSGVHGDSDGQTQAAVRRTPSLEVQLPDVLISSIVLAWTCGWFSLASVQPTWFQSEPKPIKFGSNKNKR